MSYNHGPSYQEKRTSWKRPALFSIVRRSHKHSSPTVLVIVTLIHYHHKLTCVFHAFSLLTRKYRANIKTLCNICMYTYACQIFLPFPLKIKEENYAHEVGNIVQWIRCLLPKDQELNVEPRHPRTKAGLGSARLWPQHWWMGTEEFWTLTISQSSQNLKLSRLWVLRQTLTQTKERVAGDTWPQPPAVMWAHVRTP